MNNNTILSMTEIIDLLRL